MSDTQDPAAAAARLEAALDRIEQLASVAPVAASADTKLVQRLDRLITRIRDALDDAES